VYREIRQLKIMIMIIMTGGMRIISCVKPESGQRSICRMQELSVAYTLCFAALHCAMHGECQRDPAVVPVL